MASLIPPLGVIRPPVWATNMEDWGEKIVPSKRTLDSLLLPGDPEHHPWVRKEAMLEGRKLSEPGVSVAFCSYFWCGGRGRLVPRPSGLGVSASHHYHAAMSAPQLVPLMEAPIQAPRKERKEELEKGDPIRTTRSGKA